MSEDRSAGNGAGGAVGDVAGDAAADTATSPENSDGRIFAWEGPVGLDEGMVLQEGQLGIRSSLERYSDEIVNALRGPDTRGFVLGLLGPWGSGKTSAMLTLLDLVEERLAKDLLPKGLKLWSEASPQEPLARKIQVIDNTDLPLYPVTSSVLRAPLSYHEGQSDDARLALAYAILWGLPPEMQSSIADWLGCSPKAGGDDDPARSLKIEQALRQKLRRQAATGTELERWIRHARSAYLAKEVSQGGGRAGDFYLRGNVHLTMLDDLDRAPLSYTAQILNAMRFWVDTEGMFFVVAAKADYLGEAARLANSTGAESGPQDDPVQKFVHHELHMPTLFRTPADVANYWKQLLAARTKWSADGAPRNTGLDLLRAALDSVAGSPSGPPLGVLAPLLSPMIVDPSRPATPRPRDAKRSYNALVGEVSDLVEGAGQEELKRNVASLAWRDAWLEFVHPAFSKERELGDRIGPKDMALRTALNLAGRVLPKSHDELGTAIFQLMQLAREARLDLGGIPPTLLLYLAADPPLREPAESVSVGFDMRPGAGRESSLGKSQSASIGPDLFSASRPSPEEEHAGQAEEGSFPGGGFSLRDTQLEGEAYAIARSLSLAAKAGELQEARRLTEQLFQLLERLTDPSDAKRVAPVVGNAALRLESDDAQLAWNLHRLAHSLDPEHANIRLNLSDFLLDYARGGDAWVEVERQLDWVEAHAPEHKPERQLALRARLAQARGDESGGRELIEGLLHNAMEPSAPFDEVASALVLLRQLKERQTMENVVRRRLDLGLPEDQGTNAYRLLRLLGDELIEEEGEVEGRGIDILRHLLAVAFCPGNDDVAAVLNNLALIYNNRGGPQYEQLAGMLWRHALELDTGDTTIRQAYARFIEERDMESARRLQLGQMPSIPLPAPGDVQRLVASLPAHLSSGPWWWEIFTPPEPAKGFAELAIPKGPAPSHPES